MEKLGTIKKWRVCRPTPIRGGSLKTAMLEANEMGGEERSSLMVSLDTSLSNQVYQKAHVPQGRG